jgi:hypothetical protein
MNSICLNLADSFWHVKSKCNIPLTVSKLSLTNIPRPERTTGKVEGPPTPSPKPPTQHSQIQLSLQRHQSIWPIWLVRAADTPVI